MDTLRTILFLFNIIKDVMIKNIDSLEKVTNTLFSNKRKMINKNLKKIISNKQIDSLSDFNISLRPAEIKPEIYYKITEFYEKN